MSLMSLYNIFLSLYANILHYAPLCSSLQCLPGCVPHLIASPPLSHRLTSGGRTYADNQTPEPSPPVQMEEKWTKEVLIMTLLVKMTYIYCLYFTVYQWRPLAKILGVA